MEEDQEALQRWARIMTQRGHAGMFARPNNPIERAMVERSTAAEWARSLAEQYGHRVTDINSSPSDPPDCIGVLNGRMIEIELAELVDGKILASHAGYRLGSNHRAPNFEDAQWTAERFVREVASLISLKHSKYSKIGRIFDVLLIHSDEPWLRYSMVSQWMNNSAFEDCESFRAVYLLLTYDPNHADHWPIIKLCGRLS
jgi:hypothetical protein